MVAGVVFVFVAGVGQQMQGWEVSQNIDKVRYGPETRGTTQGTQKKCARARRRRALHASFLFASHHFEGATASRGLGGPW